MIATTLLVHNTHWLCYQWLSQHKSISHDRHQRFPIAESWKESLAITCRRHSRGLPSHLLARLFRLLSLLLYLFLYFNQTFILSYKIWPLFRNFCSFFYLFSLLSFSSATPYKSLLPHFLSFLYISSSYLLTGETLMSYSLLIQSVFLISATITTSNKTTAVVLSLY